MTHFESVSKKEWIAQVERDLKGQAYSEKFKRVSLDGVALPPIWNQEDLPVEASHPLKVHQSWQFREEIREHALVAANHHIHRAIQRGAAAVSILAYPIGPLTRNQSDMQVLLQGLWDAPPAIHWQGGPLSAQVLALYLSEVRSRDLDPKSLRGGVDFDPLLDRCAGWVHAELDSWQEEAQRRIPEIRTAFPKFTCLSIRGALLEKAGASLAQELGWSLAILNEYLVALGPESAKDIIPHTEIRLGVGTSYLLEVAKLRALRLLLPNLLRAHGIEGVMPHIHATATSSNKTLYDPYNNLLRGTVEAMAMVVGGADSLTVAAYDQAYHAPDEFSEHLARNTHSLLTAEAHLDAVADPLAGSYVIEGLTHAYAERAWETLHKIEEMGGFTAAWSGGHIGQELDRVRTARATSVRRRQRLIVGTTAFGNPNESRLRDIDPKTPPSQVLPERESLQGVVDYFVDAGQLSRWLSDQSVPSSPLDPFRVSWPYEHLRLRTERSNRPRPHVALLLFGDVKMRQARSAFCQNVLAAAGYGFTEYVVNHPDDCEAATDLYVLCADDASYLPALETAKQNRRYWIAGLPETKESLDSLGVGGYIHIRQGLDETIEALHNLLEIDEYSPEKQAVTR